MICVTTESAQNGPILFTEIVSCFLERTDQDHSSWSQGMRRGETFGLQLSPEPKSHPHPTPTEPKDQDISRT